MQIVRLMGEVVQSSSNGPINGQYALQHALRKKKIPWLRIGSTLRHGEIPWWWCWDDGENASKCEEQKIPYIIGPNILFANSRNPGAISYEKDICNSTHCLLHFTESDWYRRLIVKNLCVEKQVPIVTWPYPIYPLPDGPLDACYDMLIYAKSGYNESLINDLNKKFNTIVFRYGEFDRNSLIEAARRSRTCVYLSDDDRGPIALAEILITGCPAIGIEEGAPWVLQDNMGVEISKLNSQDIIKGVEQLKKMDQCVVREKAIHFFNEDRIVDIIKNAIEKYVISNITR